MKNEATLLLLTAVTALICPPLSVSADNHFADDLKAPQLTKSAACQTIHDTINALNNTLSTNFKYQSLFFSTPMDVCQNVEAVVSASKKIAAKCNQTISNSSVNPFQSNGKEKEWKREGERETEKGYAIQYLKRLFHQLQRHIQNLVKRKSSQDCLLNFKFHHTHSPNMFSRNCPIISHDWFFWRFKTVHSMPETVLAVVWFQGWVRSFHLLLVTQRSDGIYPKASHCVWIKLFCE